MIEQVLSIEQMQELIAMDVDTSKSHLWWYYDERTIPIVVSTKCNFSNSIYIPTFTLQDILEMLPSYSITYDKYTKDLDRYEIRIDIPEKQHYITHISQSSKSLLEAAFNMLRWCKQNNYI